jgi:hypothetical protein
VVDAHLRRDIELATRVVPATKRRLMVCQGHAIHTIIGSSSCWSRCGT